MRFLFAAVLLLTGQLEAAKRSWGFDLSTGPGYRQDCITWTDGGNQEVYPHLRMFDWALLFDVHWGGLHVAGEGDRGWYSAQEMRKTEGEAFPAPASFTYAASGISTTGDLYLGYRFGNTISTYLMPLAGWLYNAAILRRTNSMPPFDRIDQNISSPYLFADASIEMTSKLRQTWQGPMAGVQLGWQPLSAVRFVGLYAYGWLHYSHSFSETDFLQYYLPGPTPGAFVQTTVQANGSGGGGHGNLGTFKMLLFLSQQISLDFGFRYFSLQSGSIKTLIEQSGVGVITRSDVSKISSAFVWSELSYRY